MISHARRFALAAIPALLLGGPSPVTAQAPIRAALTDPGHALWSERAPDVFRARVETTAGSFVIEAHREWAPLGVDRFYQLVRAGFFDDSRFYRVRSDLIVQFGIAGDPKVAEVWRNRSFPDDPVKLSNTRGYVAYANTGPGQRTTQLMVSLSDAEILNTGEFPPIGRVVEGMEVADRIYSEYGESAGGGMRGGKQGPIFEGGNEYLDREFPRLDKLLRISIIGAGS